MNRPHGRLDFVGIAVVGTAACTLIFRHTNPEMLPAPLIPSENFEKRVKMKHLRESHISKTSVITLLLTIAS